MRIDKYIIFKLIKWVKHVNVNKEDIINISRSSCIALADLFFVVI